MSKTSRPAYIPELPKWHSSMARQSRLNLGLADEISSVLAVYPWWTRRTWSVPDGPGLSLMDQMLTGGTDQVCPWWSRWTWSIRHGPEPTFCWSWGLWRWTQARISCYWPSEPFASSEASETGFCSTRESTSLRQHRRGVEELSMTGIVKL